MTQLQLWYDGIARDVTKSWSDNSGAVTRKQGRRTLS